MHIYSLEEHKIKVTSSNLSSKEKKQLMDNIKTLDGDLLSKWSPDCTHLTASQIFLTIKVLCAIITGQAIVTMRYWEELIKSVEENKELPKILDHKPPLSEDILNKRVNLDYDVRRKTLFKDKYFVFFNAKEMSQMEEVVCTAGGKCLSWDKNPVAISELQKYPDRYIILQSVSNLSQNTDSYEKVNNFLLSNGKRTIPVQEIALAIVQCSCEKHCNPSFNSTVNLITKEKPYSTGQILALETQSQGINLQNTQTESDISMAAESVVPESVEENVNFIQPVATSTQNFDDVRVKREGDVLESQPKRSKGFEEKGCEKDSTKDMFSFKRYVKLIFANKLL